MAAIEVKHHPGRHCASTGLCNLVNFHGISWSEAICFGIGAGLGIWYVNLPGITPSRLVHVRSRYLEGNFFTRIGHPFQWEQYSDPEESEGALCARLDEGIPVIIQTDIYHLPYYDSSTHFPGHIITVWGYDKAKKIFYITDTERKDVLEVSFDDMRKARFCKNDFFNIKGNLFAPAEIKIPEDMTEIIRGSIKANSLSIIESTWGIDGLAGLEKWMSEFPDWADFDDWQWTARFTYQLIEKRGTGGGGFRFLYSDFLREAALYVEEIESHHLTQMMYEAALAWRELAFSLKKISEMLKFDSGEAFGKLEQLYRLESSYHKEVISVF